MTPERYRRVCDLFHAACELPEEERDAFIAQEAQGDASLIAEVHALLANDDEAGFSDADSGGFAQRLLIDTCELPQPSASTDNAPSLPTTIGPYRILRKLGEGGMGVVYEASQSKPSRRVALKVLRPRFATGQMLRRFEHEVQVQGRLNHVGIGHVYDAGVERTQHGNLPYFAMELVDGSPITNFVRDAGMKIQARLQLMIEVCSAVQHAHDRGIIHRDLKPGNIVVTADGRPKVLDFGIARVTDADMQITTIQTTAGQLLGTLPYMSPEQIAGHGERLDHRSDIYALGVVLYELLADRLPLDMTTCSIPEAARVIKDVDPPRLGSVNCECRGDIEAIVAKTLEKEPNRRYDSADALAADLQCVLANEPISATPPSTYDQFAKFARRNKTLVGGVVATIVALAVGLIGVANFAIREGRERVRAESAQQQAQRHAYRASVTAASHALENLNVLAARQLLHEAPTEFRHWEWDYLNARVDNSVRTLSTDAESIDDLQFSPDGKTLIGRYLYAYARWNPETGESIDTITGTVQCPAVASPDMTHFATLDNQGNLRVVDAESGTEHILRDIPDTPEALAIDAANALVALSTLSGRFQIRRISDAELLYEEQEGPRSRSMRFSPAGTLLARRMPKRLVLFDAKPMSVRAEFNVPLREKRIEIAWSRDGRVVALGKSVNLDRQAGVRRFDVIALREIPTLNGHRRTPDTIRWSKSGDRMLTSSPDGSAILWDATTASPIQTYHAQYGAAFSATFDRSESMIAFGNSIGAVLVFDAASTTPKAILYGHESPVQSVAFSPDHEWIAAGAGDGSIRFWPMSLTRQSNVLRGHDSYVYPVTFSPDGRRIASAAWDGTVRLWSADAETELRVIRGHEDPPYFLRFNNQGDKLVSYGHRERTDNETIVDDLETGMQYRIESQRQRPGMAPAFLDDDALVWLPGPPGKSARFWNYRANEIVSRPFDTIRQACSPLVDADRRRILLISGDTQALEIVSISDGAVIHRLVENAMLGNWSPDGSRVISISRSSPDLPSGNVVTVWHAQSGRKLGELEAHVGDVFDAKFAPDGARIMTCGRDEQIRIWDADSLTHIVALSGHSEYVWSIAFDPTGRRLASGSGDKTVRIWNAPRSITQR